MRLFISYKHPITRRRDLGMTLDGKPTLYPRRPYKEWSPRFIVDWRSLKLFLFNRLAYYWPVPYWLAKRACKMYIVL